MLALITTGHWLLELLVEGLDKRFPHELSGGQRQRLALVRALAPQPQVLLLDEPFSNLDVDVRLRLRAELPRVLKECGVTALMVTHDPEEALAICDQVAVLSGGYWHQCAPRSSWWPSRPQPVATFVPQANVLSRDVLYGLTSGSAAGLRSAASRLHEQLVGAPGGSAASADASAQGAQPSSWADGTTEVDGQRLRLRVGEHDLSGSRCRSAGGQPS